MKQSSPATNLTNTDMDDFFAKTEHWLGRAHLFHWLFFGAFAAVSGWISFSEKIPPIIVASLAGIGAATILAVIFFGVYKLVERFPRFFGIQVPFTKAVGILYARTEGTYYNRAISEANKTPDEKLQWMGNSLLAVREGDFRARMYGKKLPSERSRLLSEAELKSARWDIGKNEFYYDRSAGPVFADVLVNRFDVYRHAQQMKKINDQH